MILEKNMKNTKPNIKKQKDVKIRNKDSFNIVFPDSNLLKTTKPTGGPSSSMPWAFSQSE